MKKTIIRKTICNLGDISGDRMPILKLDFDIFAEEPEN